LFKPEFPCLVPVTSFSEPTDAPNPATGKKDWIWFCDPLFAFCPSGRRWTSPDWACALQVEVVNISPLAKDALHIGSWSVKKATNAYVACQQRLR
jgi:hypothetical protein